MVLIYRLGYYRRATMSRCIPADSRLTRDLMQNAISKNVDELEPMNIASLCLLAFETLVGLVVGVIYCLRRSCVATPRGRRAEADDLHDPRDFFEMQLRLVFRRLSFYILFFLVFMYFFFARLILVLIFLFQSGSTRR